MSATHKARMAKNVQKAKKVKNLTIKKGDVVRVIAGKDKGAEGKVISVVPEESRVIVEGVNRVKRHTKLVNQGGRAGTTGGIITQEAAIHVSNVMLVDPDTKKRTRVGLREDTVTRDGVERVTRVRFAKRSGKDI